LCRAGVGKISIIDSDKYQAGNINRQINAFTSTIGKFKTTVTSERLYDINNNLNIKVYNEYLDKKNIDRFFSDISVDYVIDAIDTLLPKFSLIHYCIKNNLKIVSSMGAGGKTDPTLVRISDISESYNCRLAYYLRKKLHKEGIYNGFKVVFSPEPGNPAGVITNINELNKKSISGTISYMPAIFGIYQAYEVIKDIIAK
jgi:tRNA threonylcarbamoyladenosine dehydratase